MSFCTVQNVDLPCRPVYSEWPSYSALKTADEGGNGVAETLLHALHRVDNCRMLQGTLPFQCTPSNLQRMIAQGLAS